MVLFYYENPKLHNPYSVCISNFMSYPVFSDTLTMDDLVDRNGLLERYYSNGQLESKGNYKDGKKDGVWKYYQ